MLRIIRVGKNGPLISHLMFVDDFILFKEALKTQIDVVMKCLNEFCMNFRHKVN